MAVLTKSKRMNVALFLFSLLCLAGVLCAENQVLGEIQFVGATKVEKTSGVWVDGQYVGYLKELKGSKKILLLPGEHDIVVPQAGYKDFAQRVLLQPGEQHLLEVKMEKDPRVQLPVVTAEVKLSVRPNRAAVFVDDLFVGHVNEFDGPGKGMLVSPGKHRIKLALPGYQPFETEINLLANQKFKLHTELIKGSISQAGPLIGQQP